MLNAGKKKYISNPVIGLLPFVLYLILRIFVEEQYALIISIVSALAAELSVRRYFKSRVFSLSFYVSAISLSLALVFWLFAKSSLPKSGVYPIFCEMLIVCLFLILRVSKVYIAKVFFRKRNVLQKALFNEFSHVTSLIQYMFTAHIFIVFILHQFKPFGDAHGFYDVIAITVVPVLLLLFIGIYQILRIRSIARQLKREEWLPIVTETGAVTGKIAKSVSLNMKNKFLHPIVRVALISDNKVFLQERSDTDILSPRKLDYPFEKYLLYDHEINQAARNSIRQMMVRDLDEEVPLKFILKYVFENDETKRLVFLYIVRVDDEDMIKRTEKMNGKFWSVKQVEEAFADEIFSENFELEFEYMKNMVLAPADAIIFKKQEHEQK